MNRTKGNKLIAEFMGKDIQENDNVMYHSSWCWLMPVIEYIEKNRLCNFGYGYSIDNVWWCSGEKTVYTTDGEDFNCLNRSSVSKIRSIYDTVVEFIIWYNENMK